MVVLELDLGLFEPVLASDLLVLDGTAECRPLLGLFAADLVERYPEYPLATVVFVFQLFQLFFERINHIRLPLHRLDLGLQGPRCDLYHPRMVFPVRHGAGGHGEEGKQRVQLVMGCGAAAAGLYL